MREAASTIAARAAVAASSGTYMGQLGGRLGLVLLGILRRAHDDGVGDRATKFQAVGASPNSKLASAKSKPGRKKTEDLVTRLKWELNEIQRAKERRGFTAARKPSLGDQI